MLQDKDTIWLAGWLEGEGWFGLTNGSVSIQACSTDKDIIERVAMLLDAPSIYQKPKSQPQHKQAYVVRITGSKALCVFKAIRPYMGERRGTKIDELITYKQEEFQHRSNASRKRWIDPAFKAKTSAAISAGRTGKTKGVPWSAARRAAQT